MADYNQQQTQTLYQQPVQPVVQPTATTTTLPASSALGLNVQDTNFWKGALLGAAVTLLITNESVQKGVVKTVSKLTAAAQTGIEEMKEKFEDAKAEAQAESQQK